MATETEEQFQARLADWTRRKQGGEVFPGPMPRRGDAGGFGGASGAPEQLIDPTAPGAALDATQADADRTRLGGYLEQLTNQAATGGGAWEQALAQNTNATQMNAEALGQTAGLDPMNAARNIDNAQAGADQRAVGQGRLLRAQTQQQATGQLSDVLGGQGALDAQQGAAAQAAGAGLAQAERLLKAQQTKNATDVLSSTGTGLVAGAGLSNGGRVPGEPNVLADSPVNDTVEAKSTDGGDLLLTPGEIVIPLSITTAPDAPARAAAFVEAVQARGARPGQEGFAPGGEVGDALTVGRTGMASPVAMSPVKERDPTPIDQTAYDATREASLSNADRLMAAYGGKGPSVAPQAMQNATDATLADAMRAQAGSKSGPMDVTAQAAEQSQGAAGNAAGIVAGESQRAGEAFAQAIQRQRAQDLALATAQQQAAWKNTMMNAGISLEQQAQLKGLLGAAGTGAVALGGMLPDIGGGDGGGYGYDPGTNRYDTTPAWEDPGTASSPDEWAQPFAEGGVVAHLSRQGTRKPPARPGRIRREGDEPRSPFRAGAGEGDESEWTPFEGREAPKPRTALREEGPEQHFADGGEVSTYERLRQLLAGSSKSPIQFDGTGVPLSKPVAGPFAAELPPPRMMTPQEIQCRAVRRSCTTVDASTRRKSTSLLPKNTAFTAVV